MTSAISRELADIIQCMEYVHPDALLHPETRGERWLAVLGLYLDDSGSQNNPERPIFAVAGWVAPIEVWSQLTQRWQRVLNEMKAPPYHATDCEPGRDGYGHGEFKRWHKSRLLELKRKLIPLTYDLPAGVGRALYVPDHNRYLSQHPAFVNRVKGISEYLPLFLLVEAVLDCMAERWPDKPPDEQISVWFESGTLGLPVAESIYEWLRDNMAWAADSYTGTWMKSQKSWPAAQAADMLAFETYKWLEGMRCSPPRGERKLYTALIKKRPGRLSIVAPNRGDYPEIIKAYEQWYESRLSPCIGQGEEGQQ